MSGLHVKDVDCLLTLVHAHTDTWTHTHTHTYWNMLCPLRAKSIKNQVTVNLELSAEEWKRRFEREKTRADKLQALVERMQAELDRWRRGGWG